MAGEKLKARILSRNNLKTVEIEVPDWGGKVTLRSWTGTDREAFEAEVRGRTEAGALRDHRGLRGLIAYLSVVDPDTGQPVFDDPSEAYGAPATGLEAVCEAALRLNGLGEAVREELKEGLGQAPGVGSSSASPSPGAALSSSS